MSAPMPKPRVFRLPPLAYIVVLLLLFGSVPIALTVNGVEGEPVSFGPQTLVLLVPVIAAVFIARTATIVDGSGITVRAAFGRHALGWDEVRALSISGTTVYAVLEDGAMRLPCVTMANLAELSRASGGRLPELAEPTPKHPPSRRRR